MIIQLREPVTVESVLDRILMEKFADVPPSDPTKRVFLKILGEYKRGGTLKETLDYALGYAFDGEVPTLEEVYKMIASGINFETEGELTNIGVSACLFEAFRDTGIFNV